MGAHTTYRQGGRDDYTDFFVFASNFLPMATVDLLVAEDVHKTYEGPRGGVQALRGVSLSACKGEFLALRGPSGCGKSTLLHIFGAMDRATRGTVRLNGQPLDQLSLAQLAVFRRRRVGFVFQSFNLLPTLTVLDNVMLPLLLDGGDRRNAKDRGMSLLEKVGLVDRAAHFPSQLSGGEAQRVAVARAVVAEPDLLLADEPTGSLDSENGMRVMELLADLNRQFQVTILLATHADEIADFGSRTIHLRDGRIQSVSQR
jgi:putative ABC transport system ATP-binding protein